MSTITFTIEERGTDQWLKTYLVDLDTEDYVNIHDMREAAETAVLDGEVAESEVGNISSDADGVRLEDDDYDDDATYEWLGDTAAGEQSGLFPW